MAVIWPSPQPLAARSNSGARSRFKPSQGARRYARRDLPLLVARQSLHWFLRRRPAQEDRGHRRAGTKALRGAAPFRRRMEPHWSDYLWADGFRAVADFCDGRRSHTDDNPRQVTPGVSTSLPHFSAGWSSLPLQRSEWTEGDARDLPRLARWDSQATAARPTHDDQVYGRSPRRHCRRRRLAALRSRWRFTGPAL